LLNFHLNLKVIAGVIQVEEGLVLAEDLVGHLDLQYVVLQKLFGGYRHL
jgi:hypothetical protein